MIRVIYEGKKEYLPLLLLADEQEDMIDRYLDRGTMYILEEGGEALAECVVTEEDDGILEIQNLAVSETHQGKGYGRRLIEHMAELYADSFRILQVGTGDSPATVPFYEKCGFVRHHVIPGFFTDKYDHPIIDGGVLLKDMVVLRKNMSCAERPGN